MKRVTIVLIDTGIRLRLSSVVILTGLEDRDYVMGAVAAGARGFVFKRMMRADLLLAIREAVRGRIFVSGEADGGN